MVGLNGNGVGINKVLGQFQPITLDQMDSVKLMDRFDTKYFFNVNIVFFFLIYFSFDFVGYF